MKAHLLFPDEDFSTEPRPDPSAVSLATDLGLGAVLDAMGKGDEQLRSVAASVILQPLMDPSAIAFRQAVLSDCLAQRATISQIHQLAESAIAEEKKVWSVFTNVPSGRLNRAVRVLEIFSDHLRRLRGIADASAGRFASEGLQKLVESFRAELSDDYLDEMATHLRRLRFDAGVLTSARLSPAATGFDWRIHLSSEPALNWWQRLRLLFSRGDERIVMGPGDDRATELRGRAIDEAAAELSQAMEHVLSFFTSLRFEVGFYMAAANLHDRLLSLGGPTCMPEPAPEDSLVLRASHLYDAGLSLLSGARLVGNDLEADGTPLILVTGANQGGKSTFLRALGIAQVMMQAGLFVSADSFSGPVRPGVFTHYKRDEDSRTGMGRLEEELARMSQVVDRLSPGCLVLLNESFSSTNEAEGATIASALIEALLESGVTVACVTHSFELADYFARGDRTDVAFLQAERRPDGTRTFRMVPSTASPTSHGEDLYERVFGRPPTVP